MGPRPAVVFVDAAGANLERGAENPNVQVVIMTPGVARLLEHGARALDEHRVGADVLGMLQHEAGQRR